ncbi:MAG: MarR family transcriptional regulator [Pseudomonadales bacterium]|nr:MarR family transcriptional regulator [Pseudomonadales bacterium]MDG1442990.1 MarR family transcriptional regulator [Pseudomonadales bacterium]
MKDYDEILVALRRITRAIDLHSKSLQKKTGLTTSQLLVMEIINKLGSPSPSTIAREMVLSQATVTTLLDRLAKNQLVVRVKSHQDKRSVTVDLTEQGKALMSHAPELLQAGFLNEYRKLPDWQRNSLIASLQQIAYLMDAEQLDASPILDTGELYPTTDQNL